MPVTVQIPPGKYVRRPTSSATVVDGLTRFTVYDGSTVTDQTDTAGGKITAPGFSSFLVIDAAGNPVIYPKSLNLQIRAADNGAYVAMGGLLILDGGPGIQCNEDIGIEGSGDEEQLHVRGFSQQSYPIFTLKRYSGAFVLQVESGDFPSGSGIPLIRQSPTTRTPTGSYPGSYGNAGFATAGSLGVGTEVVQSGYQLEVPGQILARSTTPSIVKAKCDPGISPSQPAAGQRAKATIGIADTSIQLMDHHLASAGRTDIYPPTPFLLSIRKSYTDVSVTEVIQVTAMAGDTLTTVVRGVDGTAARQWQGPRTLTGTVAGVGSRVVAIPGGGLVSEDVNCRVVVTGCGDHGDDLITSVSSVEAAVQLHLKDPILTLPAGGAAAAQVLIQTSPVIQFLAMPASDTTSAYQSPSALPLSSTISGYGTPPFNVRLVNPDNPGTYEIVTVGSVNTSRTVANHGHIDPAVNGGTRLTFDTGTGGLTGGDVGKVVTVAEAGPLSFGVPGTLSAHISAVIDGDTADIDTAASFRSDYATVTIGTSNLATVTARGVSGTTAKAWHDGAQVQPDPLIGLVAGASATTAYIDSNGNHPVELRQNGVARITLGSIITIGDLTATRLGVGGASQNNRGMIVLTSMAPTVSAGAFGVRSEALRNTASNAGVGLSNFYSAAKVDNPTGSALTMGQVVGYEVTDVGKTQTGGGGVPTVTVQFGMLIGTLSGGTTNYGLAINGPGGAGSFPLWVNANADATAASGGIAFGLSKDTAIFRGAAGQLNVQNDLKVLGKFGANGNAPVGKQTITGSRGSATAAVLALLLTALGLEGLITDSTTA